MDSLVVVPAPTQGRFHCGEIGRQRFKLKVMIRAQIATQMPRRAKKNTEYSLR